MAKARAKTEPILLTDLVAPYDHEVLTSRGVIEIEPVGAVYIAKVLAKSPALFSLFSGGGGTVKLSQLLSEAPDAAAIIIATACGMPGDEGVAAASRLTAPDAMEILFEVAEISFPGGLEAFTDRLASRAEKVWPKDEQAGVAALPGDPAMMPMPSA